MSLALTLTQVWPRLLALGLVALFIGGLAWLGRSIPPNDGGSDG